MEVREAAGLEASVGCVRRKDRRCPTSTSHLLERVSAPAERVTACY